MPDAYAEVPIYEVDVSSGDAYRATPVRIIDPLIVGPNLGIAAVVVDPAIVGVYGGLPVYQSTDPNAMIMAVRGGSGLPTLPPGYVYYVDLDGAYLIDNDDNYLIGLA